MTSSSRRPIKILHTADVHLDLDGYGADPLGRRYRDLNHAAFRSVVDVALQEDVDLLLIAGDLFDSNRPSAEAVDFAIQQLRRVGRPIVIIPGNHDCLQTGSIYRRVDFPRECPDLLLISHPNGERHQRSDLSVVLWGRGMVEHEPSYRPLGNLPHRQGDAWHVALGHGFYTGDEVSSYRSSPISAEEIRVSGWDYVALGHCHAFSEVSQGAVTAFYAGAPSFSPGAPGADGYVALVQGKAGSSRHIAVQRIDLRPMVTAALEQHCE